MTHGMTWFRFYHEALSDRKIQKICAITGRPKFAVIGFWTSVLCMASESPERGRLMLVEDMPLTPVDIFNEMGIDTETGETFLETFVKLKLISIDEEGAYCITKWDNRQYESDNSTARVRKYRAKKAAENAPDRPDNSGNEQKGQGSDYPKRFNVVSGNVSETDQIQIRSETEREEEPPAPAGAETSPSQNEKLNEITALTEAIAEICCMDLEGCSAKQRREMTPTVDYLRKFGTTPDKVRRFRKWWPYNDPPYLSQIKSHWKRFEEALGNGTANGHSDHKYQPFGVVPGARAVESPEEKQRKLEALKKMNQLTQQMAVQ